MATRRLLAPATRCQENEASEKNKMEHLFRMTMITVPNGKVFSISKMQYTHFNLYTFLASIWK